MTRRQGDLSSQLFSDKDTMDQQLYSQLRHDLRTQWLLPGPNFFDQFQRLLVDQCANQLLNQLLQEINP